MPKPSQMSRPVMKEPGISPAPWPIQRSPTSPRIAPGPTLITARPRGKWAGSPEVAPRKGPWFSGPLAPKPIGANLRLDRGCGLL